jgi:hypothetical protein
MLGHEMEIEDKIWETRNNDLKQQGNKRYGSETPT